MCLLRNKKNYLCIILITPLITPPPPPLSGSLILWMVKQCSVARYVWYFYDNFSSKYGESCYKIPVGGSSVLGVYGFLSAFEELISQVLFLFPLLQYVYILKYQR